MTRSTVQQLKQALTEVYQNQKVNAETEVIIKLKTQDNEFEIRLNEVVLTSNTCLHSGTEIVSVVINSTVIS